jgi:hypothetical protein
MTSGAGTHEPHVGLVAPDGSSPFRMPFPWAMSTLQNTDGLEPKILYDPDLLSQNPQRRPFYVCGFAPSARPNLTQIWARKALIIPQGELFVLFREP